MKSPYLYILFGLALGIALTSHRCEREPIQSRERIVTLRDTLVMRDTIRVQLAARYRVIRDTFELYPDSLPLCVSALAACDSALLACEGVVEIRERIDTLQMEVMVQDSAALVRVTTQRDRARRWAVAGWGAALLLGVVR